MPSNICKNRAFVVNMINLLELDNCRLLATVNHQEYSKLTFNLPQNFQSEHLVAVLLRWIS